MEGHINCKQKLSKKKQRQIETEGHTDMRGRKSRGGHSTVGCAVDFKEIFMIHKVGGIVTG